MKNSTRQLVSNIILVVALPVLIVGGWQVALPMYAWAAVVRWMW